MLVGHAVDTPPHSRYNDVVMDTPDMHRALIEHLDAMREAAVTNPGLASLPTWVISIDTPHGRITDIATAATQELATQALHEAYIDDPARFAASAMKVDINPPSA